MLSGREAEVTGALAASLAALLLLDLRDLEEEEVMAARRSRVKNETGTVGIRRQPEHR